MQNSLTTSAVSATLESDFSDSPRHLGSRPLWFWNGLLDRERLLTQLQQCADSGYAGVGILPAVRMYPEFMSPEFLDLYHAVADKAAELKMKLCLYDEYWFPSGAAGGQLADHYPDALCKRLEMFVVEVSGPTHLRIPLPAGVFMGAVAMRMDNFERQNISAYVADGALTWEVSASTWKVMVFTCVKDGVKKLVDYLEPESVKKYIALTYDRYFGAFPEHFGTTIDSAFYDEPTSWNLQDGRGWTPAFNEKYRAARGEDPVPLYPALWFDIGPETASARNALFGFRAELYAMGFPRVITDWCHAHGIQLTGHMDQEEPANPVGLGGDLMKALREQDIPGIDQVFQYGRASRAYKVVSSVANNFDRPLVMTETFGGISDMPTENLYKEVMDQAAKGINLFVPHAVWYDHEKMIFPPDLALTDPVYGPQLPAFNKYTGRIHRMLQGGRHVADIAVLYPIAGLQAGYYFARSPQRAADGGEDPNFHYCGGVTPAEADYMEVGEFLSLGLRHDFTYLHPDVVAARCTSEKAILRLNNETNWEEYRVVILPGSTAISVDVLRKVRQFHDGGGKIIATTCLPDRSVEPGMDKEVRNSIEAIFRGTGRGIFLEKPSLEHLGAALSDALPVPDIAFTSPIAPRKNGNFCAIHKILEGRHIYFFGNSSADPIETSVELRGRIEPQWWNPHNGKIAPAKISFDRKAGEEITRISLRLEPVQSIFLVAPLG